MYAAGTIPAAKSERNHAKHYHELNKRRQRKEQRQEQFKEFLKEAMKNGGSRFDI